MSWLTDTQHLRADRCSHQSMSPFQRAIPRHHCKILHRHHVISFLLRPFALRRILQRRPGRQSLLLLNGISNQHQTMHLFPILTEAETENCTLRELPNILLSSHLILVVERNHTCHYIKVLTIIKEKHNKNKSRSARKV